MISGSDNKYFDLTLRRSPSVTSKIRVMASDAHNHQYFKDFMLKQNPILLQHMSPTKNGKIFFNDASGSRSQPEENLSFEYADESHAHVKELKSNHPDGTFTLVRLKLSDMQSLLMKMEMTLTFQFGKS